MIAGQWVKQDEQPSEEGQYKRLPSQFTNAIGDDNFPAENNRYHLYVSDACPWAHRALIVRKLKKLEDVISVAVVDPIMGEQGWGFEENKDTVNQAKHLYEIYLIADPKYTGKVTVPVLWDKKNKTIVSNESADIIKMLNHHFNEFGDPAVDLYPSSLRTEIDELNSFIYDNVNNGVYKAGFATTQAAYEQAVIGLFNALEKLEHRLEDRQFLIGEQLTLCDIRLFTTLIRFDPVYHGHFKCNMKRIVDYKNLSLFVKLIFNNYGIEDTIHFENIKKHYYMSHVTINPNRIVPVGPAIDYL